MPVPAGLPLHRTTHPLPSRCSPPAAAVGSLAKLNEFKLPAFFLCGEFDRLCPGARLKETLAEALPDCDCRVMVLEASGVTPLPALSISCSPPCHMHDLVCMPWASGKPLPLLSPVRCFAPACVAQHRRRLREPGYGAPAETVLLS